MRAVQGQTVCVPPQRLRAAKARARLHDLAVRAAPEHAQQLEVVLTDGDRGHCGRGVGGAPGRVHVTAVSVVLVARCAAWAAAAHATVCSVKLGKGDNQVT